MAKGASSGVRENERNELGVSVENYPAVDRVSINFQKDAVAEFVNEIVTPLELLVASNAHLFQPFAPLRLALCGCYSIQARTDARIIIEVDLVWPFRYPRTWREFRYEGMVVIMHSENGEARPPLLLRQRSAQRCLRPLA